MGLNTSKGEMMLIILALLASYGLTAILIESPLFGWLRWILVWLKLPKLAKCYRCLGFWVGLLVGSAILSGVGLLLFPFAASGVSYLLHRLIGPPVPPPIPSWAANGEYDITENVKGG